MIELPVSQPTCCTFGGADGGTLFITSAKYKLPKEKLAKEPLAGNLFAIRPGVKGPADQKFKG